MIVQNLKIIAGPDLRNLTKNRKSTILSENFKSNTDHLDEVLINLGLIRNFLIHNKHARDSSKTENYCRSGPVKFDENLKIDKSIRKHQ